MKKITTTLGLILCFSLSILAQTAEERAQITANYDLEKLDELKNELSTKSMARLQRAYQLADEKGIPKMIKEDSRVGHLYDFVDGNPIYQFTLNQGSVQMQGADAFYQGGSLGVNITGQGMRIGIWDGGAILNLHEALSGRLFPGEGLIGSGHATHVGGTMIANAPAPNQNATGVAPSATLVVYGFETSSAPTPDGPEMISEASNGMLLSNHSYGVDSGNLQQAELGKYVARSAEYDAITFNAPYYLPVVASGNDGAPGQITNNGLDTMNRIALAKNVVSVGASNETLVYTGPASITIANFSSKGPSDDSRVKPDITTKGVNTFSTENTGTNSYGTRIGTSMAAPAVTGGLTLLQQYYNSLNNQYMKSATAKGLILHTAFEVGQFDGPDFSSGWGSLNTEAAGLAIQNDGGSSLIDERTLSNNGSYSTSFTISSSSLLQFSISWTDPAGVANNGGNDDPTPALVNNLDITVTDGQGNTFFPYTLNAQFPAIFPRTDVPNLVDNFERIDIKNAAGTYTINITHTGTLVNNQQDYTLIVTGAEQSTFSTNGPDSLDKLSIYPNPANDRFTVTFNNQLSGDSINVNVYDVLGQLVISKQYNNIGVFEQTIDASTLNSGVYLVKVGNGVTSSTKKLIIR